MLGEPKTIDDAYIKSEAERFINAPYKKYQSTDEDIRFILKNL